ncbi:Dbl homology domain-containing protein [Violaceomyces palustris]|uniref:Dbl homology domain-containing protein n=1 Tax=Violaceomyces palustris TaxID=1673888 RepID=A0ACD0NR64_9BASI|nr:Dbl homology domain-containing protein [Violaceomyces palustris]
MKRFFSRFSNQPPAFKTAAHQPVAFDSEQQNQTPWEKPAINTLQSIVPNEPSALPGNKVRALAARFEATVAAPQPQLGIQHPSSTLVRPNPASHPPSDHDPEQDRADTCQRLSPRPSPVPDQPPLHDGSIPNAAAVAPPRKGGQEPRQPSSSSTGSAGSATTAGVSKTVAFAPSPEKTWTTGNSSGQRPPSPSPASARPGEGPLKSNESVPLTGNFAKPTVASQARARHTARGNTSDSPAGSGQWSVAALEKTLASVSRTTKLVRANSTGAPSTARRVTTNGDVYYNISPPTIASSSPVAGIATASSTSLAFPGLRRTSTDHNTIPFATGPAAAPVRSASPVSIAASPASAAMQITGSGQGSTRPSSSRRGSWVIKDSASSFGSVGAKGFGGPSWSEMTQEDLVANLGPRERTRQEVLWEIVASEERYVAELEKTTEFYINALLHPHSSTPHLSPRVAQLQNLGGSLESGSHHTPRRRSSNLPKVVGAGWEGESSSSAELPIAARFMSSLSANVAPDSSNLAAQAQAESQRAAGDRSPYSATFGGGVGGGGSTASPRRLSMGGSRVSSSMPSAQPLTTGHGQRGSLAQGLGIGIGIGRPSSGQGIKVPASPAQAMSAAASPAPPVRSNAGRNVSAAFRARTKARSSQASLDDQDPTLLTVPLPVSLRAVLESISEGLMEGHALLSDALKARYEEQWPLVRSLADVFLKHAYILKHYANYVCHLQRALEELEEAALMERALRGKKLKRERLTQTVGLGRTVAALESAAYERGECGLSIFISKPFQRLLKYPLLFQNLLFHTDPSTYEFESTVAMVVEVERMVRSIEDEKVSAEERDKVRDAFARIEGLTDKGVLKPRSDRFLVEEKALYDENPRRSVSESAPKDQGETGNEGIASEDEMSSSERTGGAAAGNGRWGSSPGLRAALRSKRSYRRLSDFLSGETQSQSTKAPGMGSKKDLWLVRFSDVELKCQRVGVTALPMVSSTALNPPTGGSTSGNAQAGASSESEALDFAARSKDSKERLKALRNTTLRAKTRNLYKFVSVVAWKNVRPGHAHSGQEEVTAPDGLPTSHEVDEECDEDEEQNDDDEDSDADGLDSAAAGDSSGEESSDEGESGFINSEKYVRQSKLSFSYWGDDKVEPRVVSTSLNGAAGAVGSTVAFKTQNHTRSSTSSAGGLGSGAARATATARTAQIGGGARAPSRQSSTMASARSQSPTKRAHQTNHSLGGATGAGSAALGQVQWNGNVPIAPLLSLSSTEVAPTCGISHSNNADGRMASHQAQAVAEAQNVVANMHSKSRNEKFSNRLRNAVDSSSSAFGSGSGGGGIGEGDGNENGSGGLG